MLYLGYALIFIGLVILPILAVVSLNKTVIIPYNKKALALGSVASIIIGFVIVGNNLEHSDPNNLESLAQEAGFSEDEYTVHDNGAIELHPTPQSDNIVNYSSLVTQGENWKYVINNAIQIADAYATKNNPSATFISNKNLSANLVKQYGGKYEGGYLLILLNDNKGSVSYAQLKPLFDVNKSVDELEDRLNSEDPLWEVVLAKYNGKEF